MQVRPGKIGLYDPSFEHESCGVGFVAHIGGEHSHSIIEDAQEILLRMDHRGAVGAESNTGDGSGILTALPHEFFERVAHDELNAQLPARDRYGAGLVFLPHDHQERKKCKDVMNNLVSEQGQRLIGWRRVPVLAEESELGETARASEPYMEHVLIAASDSTSKDEFERCLYMIRKKSSHYLQNGHVGNQSGMFYICSLSNSILVYKGMLRTSQLATYFPDLCDTDYISNLAMVHSRFSTNTFPSWDRAQPQRLMAHNGEINTLRGNLNWMRAREGVMDSELFGQELKEIFPIIEPDCSDSGSFDNVLEFLLMSGRELPEAMMMMVPEAWQKHRYMEDSKRSFYEYHSTLMEPWDGPASIAFTDGRYVGAILDRNGLRPSRYYLTVDDRVIMASEVGVLPVPPNKVREKGRLQPGRMFLVDLLNKRLVPDAEVKEKQARAKPYTDWLRKQRIKLSNLPVDEENIRGLNADTLLSRLHAFGYTQETLQFMLIPLVNEARDPIGSMGNDAPLSFLTNKPRLVYDYFKQLFAQVTNPAIDPIREDIVMSLSCYVGPEGNLLQPIETTCHRLLVDNPILTNRQLRAIQVIQVGEWQAKTIDVTFDYGLGISGMRESIERACTEAESAVDLGYSLVVLSDRGVSRKTPGVSMLLVGSAVHQHLVRSAKRSRIGLVVETGEASEVHHHCLLLGYGIDAINPYLAYEALWQARRDSKLLDSLDSDEVVVEAYRLAVSKGIMKVMAKMGISTLQSYKGAQIFEAVGLSSEVIDLCFTHTSSRIEGIGFEAIASDILDRHRAAFFEDSFNQRGNLPNPGEYHWRPGGHKHAWNPTTISNVQKAAIHNDISAYQVFADQVNCESSNRLTLRGLMDFDFDGVDAIPIEHVESSATIVRRFCTGAMSFGSISPEAHETLAVAMNRVGGRSNTGEGGEDPDRFETQTNGDSRRSAIKQVASGRFGVTAWYLTNADEIQIKVAQGAKPGEGGELPGIKVDEQIARIRYSTPGVGLISPPPHHDVYSIEDLAQLIYDLKNANPLACISVKLVSEVGVGTIAAGVAKAHADLILISGDSGGTGASALTSIKYAGLPWELGIAEAHQTLVLNDLRSRVILQTDGGIKTGRDVVIAAMLGAEEIGFSTAPLIALGCIMMRKCHLNTCPVGIATQDPDLRKKFQGKPEHVINYLFMVAEEVRGYMSKLGFQTFDDMIGRSDILRAGEHSDEWNERGIDLKSVLQPAQKLHPESSVYCSISQDHGLDRSVDKVDLIPKAEGAISRRESVKIELPIANVNRAAGTMLSHVVVKRWGEAGLPDNTIHVKFFGSAGQSFGAWLARGITLELEGDANDYVGKGLSGGHVIIYPPNQSKFCAEENIIVGNVVLYGATSGRAFVRGMAAERFCIRNSGAVAVVEGVGDHGCEYMTGGRVVVLGPVGRNFAAGMSGGIAYVFAPDLEALSLNCNLEMIVLERIVDNTEDAELLGLIEEHYTHTGSKIARALLDSWSSARTKFVRVIPRDYQKIIMARQKNHVVKSVSDKS